MALDAFGKVFELVYKPYINVVWVLSYFRVGKIPPANPPAVGAMFNVSRERLTDFTELLEADAVWIRNAAIHDWPDPKPDYNVLQLRDADGNVRELTVDEVIARAESMFLMSAQTIQLVGQLYLYRLFLKPELLEVVTDCMTLELVGDEKGLRRAEERAQAYGDSLTESLRRFLEQG